LNLNEADENKRKSEGIKMDASLKTKLQNLVSNPGYILTRPLKTEAVHSKKGVGFQYIDNGIKLEAVEVLVGNGSDRPKGTLRILTGDLVYIKSDRYTQPWAKERITAEGFVEAVDGKSVPLQFVMVPVNEVVFVSAANVDYSEYFRYQPYWYKQGDGHVYYGDPPSQPNLPWTTTKFSCAGGEGRCLFGVPNEVEGASSGDSSLPATGHVGLCSSSCPVGCPGSLPSND
jgi:hypothetical protein